MSVTVEKLRALKRQAGSSAPSLSRREGEGWDGVLSAQAQAPDSTLTRKAKAVLPSPPLAQAQTEEATPSAAQSIESLRRLLGVRHRAPAPPQLARAATPQAIAIDRTLPGVELAPGLRLIESRVPIPAAPASWSLAFAKRTDALDPRDVLFFDTETTGLAGGTGTRAFMIGAADLLRDHDCRATAPDDGTASHDPAAASLLAAGTLRIRQLLITTMAAEPLMLQVFAGWLSPRTALSSYNGRCYDAPLLRTRYRLARLPDALAVLDHVDLLFPSRRRWRGRWENCRLATIEREALGILRDDDLPGSQAPAAWLRYIRGGSASLLRRVLAHNHQDVVTLALLMARLVALHDADDAAPSG